MSPLLSTDSACFVVGPRFTPMNEISSFQRTGISKCTQDSQSVPPNTHTLLALTPRWWRINGSVEPKRCLLWERDGGTQKWAPGGDRKERSARQEAFEISTTG